ncbi:MAG: DUF3611 family protein [Cyanobacteria bacterium J06597_1]
MTLSREPFPKRETLHPTEVKWLGRVSLWIQVVVAISSITLLLFAFFSRRLGEGPNSPVTGIAITFALLSVLTLVIGAGIVFRYIRLAKKLENSRQFDRHAVSAISKTLSAGVYVGLTGILLSFIGGEVGSGILLVKALSIPQGTDIYDPQKVIRVLDILIVVSSITTLGAHVAGHLASFWLKKRFA